MNTEHSALGIEFGSTRIKAVLIDENHIPVASGSFTWENSCRNGIWTYGMDEALHGLQECYRDLKKDYEAKYGEKPRRFGAIGISGMMHGYLPLDESSSPLVPFRTWRNTITGEAAEKLTSLFSFNIPQRWSVAHLYQAVLNREEHLCRLKKLTTLAGYFHFLLTGRHVLGIGEASGMFPIDSRSLNYDRTMAEKFLSLTGIDIFSVLPEVLTAGKEAGKLTEKGALILDCDGDLEPGIPFCPPEGDAGTGMTATNSVRVRSGNVSAGTSDFAMVVVDRPLSVHREIDMVTTPDGSPVAMVHCNNCTSDINAWVKLLGEAAESFGVTLSTDELYSTLFRKALEGDKDCGGLMSYNYYSGEGVTDINAGRPVFIRTPEARFNLPNFMRAHLLSALATLKIGLDILTREEKVEIEKLYGHGGFFKTEEVGQRLLSAAAGVPVSVMETAGEGGPYGMALLAMYMISPEKKNLAEWLENEVFKDRTTVTVTADEEDCEGFRSFLDSYRKAFPLERLAVEVF